MLREEPGDLRPTTDVAQRGVNAFVVVSCGFCLISTAANNNMNQADWSLRRTSGETQEHNDNEKFE